jgi:hypothetical protein
MIFERRFILFWVSIFEIREKRDKSYLQNKKNTKNKKFIYLNNEII